MIEITARIYQPTKSAMQSAKEGKEWVLELIRKKAKFIDSVMGWHGSSDTQPSQVKLKFPTLKQAEKYAKSKGLEYKVEKRNDRKLNIKSYNKNFA
jgi:hypothetical protein